MSNLIGAPDPSGRVRRGHLPGFAREESSPTGRFAYSQGISCFCRSSKRLMSAS